MSRIITRSLIPVLLTLLITAPTFAQDFPTNTLPAATPEAPIVTAAPVEIVTPAPVDAGEPADAGLSRMEIIIIGLVFVVSVIVLTQSGVIVYAMRGAFQSLPPVGKDIVRSSSAQLLAEGERIVHETPNLVDDALFDTYFAPRFKAMIDDALKDITVG